jgi:hypothetical protein
MQRRVALVLSDRAGERETARTIFEEAGFVASIAGTPASAMALLRAHMRSLAMIFVDFRPGDASASIDFALNAHCEFPWVHLIVASDDPTVLEELPCACMVPRSWRHVDLLVEAERVTHFGSTDELSLADAARHVLAHERALSAAFKPR